MSAPDYAVGLIILAVGGVAAWLAGRNARTGPIPRAGLAMFAGVAAAIAVAGIITEWLAQPGNPWNAARLAPAVSLKFGYALYYPLHEGPILSTVVGPVAFLFYVPVAFFFNSPTSLILAGSLLNLAGWTAMAALLVWRITPCAITRLFAALALAHLALLYPALRYSLFGIHADAPALIFATLGAGLIVFTRDSVSWRRAFAASLALVLAVWAKQSLVALIPLLVLLTAILNDRTSAVRLAGAGLVIGTIVSLGFVSSMGLATLRDNMLTVPAAHPWQQMDLVTGQAYSHLHPSGPLARSKVLAAAILQIVRTDWLLFAAMGASVVMRVLRQDRVQTREPRSAWFGLFVLALGMLPLAALGRVKVGGEINHEALVLCFLVPALVGWLAEPPPAHTGDTRGVLLVAVLAVLAFVNAPRATTYRGWAAAWDNQNEVALDYERAHPGRVYFPWNPLTSLLAHGKLHHFDYGVFDRGLGREAVTREHVLAHLPGPEPIIARHVAHHDHILRTYFPDHLELPRDAALPGWRLYGPAGQRERQ